MSNIKYLKHYRSRKENIITSIRAGKIAIWPLVGIAVAQLIVIYMIFKVK